MATRKDFDAVAAAIKSNGNDDELDRAITARGVANAFAANNPRFDKTKFLVACGVKSHTVHSPWGYGLIQCQCGSEQFLSNGRTLDRFEWTCVECGTANYTMTETGMSA